MLLAFGGAGPVHAGRMARDLGMAGMIAALSWGLFGDRPHHVRRQARPHPVKMAPISTLTAEDVNHVRTAGSPGGELRDDGFAPEAVASSARSTCAMPARATRSRCRAATPTSPRCAKIRRAAPRHVRPWRARRAGRGRLVSGAGARPGAAGRDAARFKPTGATLDDARRNAAGAHGRRHHRVPGLSARAARRGHELAGPAILDQFDCTTVIYRARPRAWTNGRT